MQHAGGGELPKSKLGHAALIALLIVPILSLD